MSRFIYQARGLRGLFALLFIFTMAFSANAQSSFILSSYQGADSSESFFPDGATLYMHVVTNELNVHQMKKMTWTIKKSHDDMMDHENEMESEFSGNFTNNFDSTFTASFDLSQLSEGGKWEWNAKFEDKNQHKVMLESYFYYKNYDQDSSYSYMEIKGYIQSIGEDSLVINGYVFYVDSNTVVEYKHDHNYSFSDLKVNDYVEVKARELADGTYLAERIELENSDDNHYTEIKAKGTIESVTDSSITVNGKSFTVDTQTKIKSHDHEYLSLSDLSVGMYVEIKAKILSDGSYLALEIEVEKREEYSMDIELKGEIDSVGTDYILVAGQKIVVDGQTKIELKEHQPGTLSDLQPGMKVEVKAYRLTDGTLLAREIEVENGNFPYDKIELTGAIDSVGTDFIQMLGYTVNVDSNTIIVDSHYMPITLADLLKGQIVKVKGYVQTDGSVQAYKIKVKELWTAFFKIEGTIEALGTDEVTVRGLTFRVDSSTAFYNYDGTPIQFGDLSVGQLVKIKAKIETEGSYLAVKVKLIDEKKTQIEVTGAIQYLTTDSIKVNGIMFFVDSNTVVYDLQDNPMNFSELALDQIVEVKGIMQADSSFWAVRIKVEDDPNLVTMSSSLMGKTENSLILADAEFKMTGSTVILNKNFEVIDLSSLTLGDNITIWAIPSNDGSYETLQIQDETNGSITSTEDLTTSPVIQSFVLKQNYPNPFNPSTTIEFNLSQNGFAKVKLEVFNMLGQKVQTLFNGVLNSGTYQFKWDGRNDAAQSVASGIYFYKLTVNQNVKIKQMVLIR